MHALIIEPESFVALMIQEVLEETGFDSFAFAATGEEAVEAADERCPDLIVADVDFQQGCAIASIQSICAAKPIPVVFACDTHSEALAQMPTARAVRKPFGATMLLAALAEARAGIPPL